MSFLGAWSFRDSMMGLEDYGSLSITPVNGGITLEPLPESTSFKDKHKPLVIPHENIKELDLGKLEMIANEVR